MTDRELLEQIATDIALMREQQNALVTQLEPVIGEALPVIQRLAESPLVKMIGGRDNGR